MMSSILPASGIDALASPVAVVAHDAGAANLIIAWLRDYRHPVAAHMAGPAAQLWQQILPDRPLCVTTEAALVGAATLLSGTGWASDVEHEARVLAAVRGIASVAVLDHWVNYPMRFERGGVVRLPDALIVSDGWAANEARRCFGDVPVIEWPNIYLQQQIADIAPVKADGDFLYICEPARSNWGRASEGEFQALEFLSRNLAHIGLPGNVTVRLRLHPSEPAGKYDTFVAEFPYMRIDDSRSLARSIDEAKWVGGMGSAAMVVALAAGREVICTLPPWAPQCPLPHDGIRHLRAMPGAV